MFAKCENMSESIAVTGECKCTDGRLLHHIRSMKLLINMKYNYNIISHITLLKP